MIDIDYSVIRSPKRKTVSIIIRANNQVDVLAPNHVPAARIHSFVQDKSNWVQKKLQFNQDVRARYQAKTFAEGEAFDLLGKSYRLDILEPMTPIHITDDKLIAPSQQPDKLKKSLITWYRQKAEEHFQQRCDHFAAKIGKTPAFIGVKTYKSRWGSCHHDGRIFFNWRLIMAPTWVIDYVVVHELCHLIHHNHSKAFWNVVEQTMPDYRQAKDWLKTNGLMLEL